MTSDSLIVFVKKKLKESLIEDYELASSEALTMSDNILQSYDLERVKHSVFQYESTEEVKISKARTYLERAEQFSKEIEKLLIS